MNAEHGKTYIVDVQMALSGTKAMRNKLVNTMSDISKVKKEISDLGIGKIFEDQISNLQNRVSSSFTELNNYITEYQRKLKEIDRAKLGGADVTELELSLDDSAEEMIAKYKEYLSIVADTTIEVERLKQVSKSSIASQEAEILKTITLMEKYGVSIRQADLAYQQAAQKAEVANSAAPLAKYNQELTKRYEQLSKIRELQNTMQSLGLDSSKAAEYRAELARIEDIYADFSKPIKEADVLFKNLKLSPKLIADMEAASKYAKDLGTDLQKAISKSSDPKAIRELLELQKKLEKEQQNLVKGGKEEYSIAKKNISVIDERYKKYKQLNEHADRLLQLTNDEKNLQNGVSDAVGKVIDKLRAAALEQFDLSKSTREHNGILKEALTFESQLNSSLKEKNGLEIKLLNLQTKLNEKLSEINRVMKQKAPYATKKSLEEAKAVAKELEKEIDSVGNKLQEVRGIGAIDGNIDSHAIKVQKAEVEKLNRKYSETSLRIKEVKANLAELSQIKWGGNILKRAVAYASMYAGIYEVISVMRKGVTAVVEYDTQMRTIQAVFDVTGNTAKNLADNMLALGRAWGGSVQDINEAALALGRAGIATEKVTEATEVVIKMAKLTGDSIAVSASAVITYQQVFGDTHPILKEVGDQLAYVANQSRLSTQDIGTFSNYALAAAKSAGLSMEAINAMATSFSNAGVNASTIGTQIRRFSSLMRDNSTAAKEFFLKIGTTQEAFAAQMQRGKKSADEAMTWIANRLKSLSNEEFQKTIQGMDILASNSITLLRNNADEFLRHFQTLNEGVQGEIDKANLISDGYQASFEKMKIAASDAFIAISETAAPVVQGMLDSMAEYFDYIKAHKTEVVAAIDSILNTAKWVAISAIIVKVVNALSLFSSNVGGLLSKILPVTAAVEALSAGFLAAAGAVRAFLATNPVGWAILATGAIAGAAISIYDYATAVDKAAEAQKNYRTVQDDIKAAEKTVSENRKELGQLMLKLGDNTYKASEAELARAAQLEYAIQKDEAHIKVLREKQKLIELQGKATVTENNLKIIEQKIKLAEDDGNMQLLGSLKRQKERLEAEKINITVKFGIEKSRTDFKQGVTAILDEYKATAGVLQKLKDNGVGELGLKQRQDELKALEKQLKDVYNLDINMFKGKDVEAELEKYLNTLQGKMNALDAELKVGVGLPEDLRQRLQEKLNDLKKVLAESGLKANDIFREVDFNKFKEMGQSIVNQIKAGMDVGPQVEAQFAEFERQFQRIKDAAAVTAIEVSKHFEKAVEGIAPKNVDTRFYELVNQIKEAQKAFANAGNAKAAQVAVSQMKNALAELKEKYGEVAQEAVNRGQEVVNVYNKENLAIQKTTGEIAKLGKAMYGDNSKTVEKAKELSQEMRAILETNTDLKMSYSEIMDKMTGEVDLAWQIKNANISAHEADLLRVKTKQELAKLEAQLIQLLNAYNAAASETSNLDEQTKAKVLEEIAGMMTNLIEKSQNMVKNLKAADGKYKSLHKSGSKAANAAKKHAEQVERAVRAITKLEADYRSKIGDFSLSAKLGIESDIMKIEEMGRKAEYSKQKIEELKALYLEGKEMDVDRGIVSALSDASGIQGPMMMQKYEDDKRRLEEYYEQKKAIIQQKEAEIAQMEAAGMDEESVEDLKRQLDLEKHKLYLEEKWRLDNQYYMDLAASVNAGLTDALGVMEQLYSSGLVRSKGFLRAMQALKVAQAIMTTYQAATKAYELGLETGGPAGPAVGAAYAAIAIAQGMAKVAMIKSQKFHTGGYVDKPLSSGVGGKKDDEINAVLQKGEYVLSKQEVAQIKAQNRRNTGQQLPSEKQETNTSDSKSIQTREIALLAESMKPEVVIVNSQDPAVIEDWATSRRGREVIQNIVNG